MTSKFSAPTNAGNPISFVVFGDPQIGLAGANKDMERFRLAVDYVNKELYPEVELAIIVGDLTNAQEDFQVAKYREIEKQLKPRVFRLPGNHDIWNAATHAKYLKDFEMDSSWYSATISGCEFILLDTIVLNAGSVDLQPLKLTHWVWLEETLERCSKEGRRRVFVFGHHPPYSSDPEESGLGEPTSEAILKTLPRHWRAMHQSTEFNLASFRKAERMRFQSLLDKHAVSFYACGHTHMNQLWGSLTGSEIPAYSIAGTTMLVPEVDNSTNGVRVWRVDADSELKTEWYGMEFKGDLKPPFLPADTVDFLRKRKTKAKAEVKL
jgi:3',5'-cyclic AMP phosphodiesterase CpdA